MKRTHTKYLISLGLIIGGGVWLVQRGNLSLDQVWPTFRQFHLSSLCLALVFTLGQVAAQITRFWILIPRRQLTWLRVASAFSMGQLINNFVPARAGDVVKIVLMSRKSTGPSLAFEEGVGATLSDKLVDFLSLVALVLVSGTLFLPEIGLLKKPSIWIYVAIPIVVLIFIVVGRIMIARGGQRLSQAVTRLKAGVVPLSQPKIIFFSVLTGSVSWLLEALTLKTLCSGQDIALSFAQSTFVLCVLNLALAVPISIGNVGPFEASLIFALGRFGVPVIVALAIGTVHHGFQIFAVVVWVAVLWLVDRFFKKDSQNGIGVNPEDKSRAVG